MLRLHTVPITVFDLSAVALSASPSPGRWSPKTTVNGVAFALTPQDGTLRRASLPTSTAGGWNIPDRRTDAWAGLPEGPPGLHAGLNAAGVSDLAVPEGFSTSRHRISAQTVRNMRACNG